MPKKFYTVVRDFPHSEPNWVGKTVDVSDWQNADLLEAQGYIAPIEEVPIAEPISDAVERTENSMAESDEITKGEPEVEFEINPKLEAEILGADENFVEKTKAQEEKLPQKTSRNSHSPNNQTVPNKQPASKQPAKKAVKKASGKGKIR